MKANFSITSFSAGPTGPSSGAPGKKSYRVKKPTSAKTTLGCEPLQNDAFYEFG